MAKVPQFVRISQMGTNTSANDTLLALPLTTIYVVLPTGMFRIFEYSNIRSPRKYSNMHFEYSNIRQQATTMRYGNHIKVFSIKIKFLNIFYDNISFIY